MSISNTYNIGGAVANAPGATIALANIANAITLIAGFGGAQTSGNFYPFYRQDTGAAYQVTAGKTFRAAGFYLIDSSSSVASNRYQFVTATAAFTFDSSTVPAGVVYYGGAANRYNITNMSGVSYVFQPWPISFPASTFAATQGNGASVAYFVLVGEEV